MRLSELGEISKSQVARGQWEKITRVFEGKHVGDTPWVEALQARLKGRPVYTGGTKRRVTRVARGKPVNTKSGTGYGQSLYSGGGVFTTPYRESAETYAMAGRTRANYEKYGERAMNHSIRPRANGAIGVVSTKGIMPKRVLRSNGSGTEIVYDPADLKGKVRVDGLKRGRSAYFKWEMKARQRSDRRILRGRRMREKGIDMERRPMSDQRAEWWADDPTQAEASREARKRMFGG